jgi:hypothetical protein
MTQPEANIVQARNQKRQNQQRETIKLLPNVCVWGGGLRQCWRYMRLLWNLAFPQRAQIHPAGTPTHRPTPTTILTTLSSAAVPKHLFPFSSQMFLVVSSPCYTTVARKLLKSPVNAGHACILGASFAFRSTEHTCATHAHPLQKQQNQDVYSALTHKHHKQTHSKLTVNTTAAGNTQVTCRYSTLLSPSHVTFCT